MAMNKVLDELVDRCLSDIQSGQTTIEECLTRHPEVEGSLEPLLRLAAYSHELMAPDSPNPVFVQNAQIRLLNQIRTKTQSKQPRKTHPLRMPRLFLRPAYALVAILLVFALFTSGIGVVRASASSLPGDNLYGLKRASEQIQLVMSLSSDGDKRLLLEFVETRMEEVEALLNLERYEDIDEALVGLDENLGALSELDASTEDEEPGSYAHVEEKLEKHIQVLQEVLEKVPENARPAIERALERSSRSIEVIEKVKSGDHPSNNAPGQLKKDGEEQDIGADHPGRGNGLDKDKPEKPEKPTKTIDPEG